MTDRYANMERLAMLAAKSPSRGNRVHRCPCGVQLQPIAQKNGIDYYAGMCGGCAEMCKPMRAPGGA